MITRTMWFISAHEPTKEQIIDAKNMGYFYLMLNHL